MKEKQLFLTDEQLDRVLKSLENDSTNESEDYLIGYIRFVRQAQQVKPNISELDLDDIPF